VTDPSLPHKRTHGADEHSRDGRQRGRGRYLPSAEVLAELAVLGPGLARLAADLRDRLNEQGNPTPT